MPTATEQVFLALLRSALTGETPPAVTPDDELFKVAAKHDLSHLVADVLDKGGCLGTDEVSSKFKKARYVAVYRYEQIRYELEAVGKCLQATGIPFLPLKGAVMREYYSDPWMRTSCDIDVLVHPEDVQRAVQALCETEGYRQEGVGTHDVSLFSPSGVHVELHYDTVEEGRAVRANNVLADVWKHSAGDGCYRMSDAMFYFYHVAHMAKHLEVGGCGVRSFIDLWLLERSESADKDARKALLKAGGLERFAEAAKKLAAYWFSGAEADETVGVLEDFVLRGGVFGTSETVVLTQRGRYGKGAYLFRSVFPPRRVMVEQYHVLEKHGWLYPFYWVYRLGGYLFGKNRHTAASRVRHAVTAEEADAQRTRRMLESLELL